MLSNCWFYSAFQSSEFSTYLAKERSHRISNQTVSSSLSSGCHCCVFQLAGRMLCYCQESQFLVNNKILGGTGRSVLDAKILT